MTTKTVVYSQGIMGNQNMLVNLSIFAFFIYLTFIVATHLTGSSLTELVGIKSPYVTVQSQSDAATTNRIDVVRGVVSRLQVSLTPQPTSTWPYTYDERAEDQLPNISMITPELKGQMKTENFGLMRGLKKQIVNSTDKPKHASKSFPHCRKVILFWCEDTIGHLGKYKCQKSQCEVKIIRSVSLKDLKKADAVVFYHMMEKPWDDLIRSRPRGQMWVFFSRESPYHCRACMPPASYRNVFNMSLTYLSDSDIVAPYGRFYPFKKMKKPNLVNWAQNKTKQALWVASNCLVASWDRAKFVKHLATFTKVDIYGRCGSLSCPKEQKEKCEKIFSQYKFYLALENSHCREYITEKVWHNSFERNIVPIVFGANREDYESVLPPNSFIFAEDFNSTRDLAIFLDRLDRNDTLYNEYFQWRREGYIKRWTRSMTFTPKNFCQIVDRLVGNQSAPTDAGSAGHKNRNSVEDWWRSSCFEKTHFKFADQ